MNSAKLPTWREHLDTSLQTMLGNYITQKKTDKEFSKNQLKQSFCRGYLGVFHLDY